MRKVLPLFALLLFIMACNESISYRNVELNEEIAEMLRETAMQIHNNPDAALLELNTMYNENRNYLTTLTKISIYLQMGNVHSIRGEFDLSDSFYLKAFRLAEKENDIANKVRSKISMGGNQHNQGNMQKNIDFYRQAQLILANHKEIDKYTKKDLSRYIYGNLGSAFAFIGNTNYARHYIQLTLDIARQMGNKRSEAGALESLAQILFMYGEYSQAEQLYRSALELAENIDDRVFLSVVLFNLAATMFTMNREDEALHYLERSQEVSQELGIPSLGRVNIYSYQGWLYFEKQEYANSLRMFYKSLELAREFGNSIYIASSYSAKGQVHSKIGNYNKALYYANKALEIAKREGAMNLLVWNYETISYTHARQGNVEQFSQAMALSHHYRDSIFTQQRFATIQEIQTRFQTEQKQQEIILQQKEIQTQRATNRFLILTCVFITILLIVLCIAHRKELRQQMQIIRQHEELSNYVRKGQQSPTEKTNGTTVPDDVSRELLAALDQLFESEKIYRNADLNIVDVANKLGSNRTYLSKVINLYHQKSFSDYVNYYRIEDAKKIFRAQNERKYTNYTNEYIAEKVGFGSPAQFYRAFKQIVGITSTEYKQTVREMKMKQ